MRKLATISVLAFLGSGVIAVVGQADGSFDRISSKQTFENVVVGKSLTRLGVKLDVTRDGDITGNAFGLRVTGDWTWEDGYFCRTLYYGRETVPRNCQMVKLRGQTLRFIADKGQGDIADLRIR